jgi:phospholipase/lecithinase/hemolysin
MTSINLQSLGLPSSLNFIANAFNVPSAPAQAPAAGARFSTIYAFGDSLSDAGNIYAATLHLVPTAPYVNGEFSNGPVWVQDLAGKLGLPAPKASLTGGTDFAYGGAETGADPLHPQNPSDLPSQFAQFVVRYPVPQANALYTLSAGSNDVFDAIAAYPTNPSAAAADVTQAVANETAFVSDLAARGAREFLVLNVPNLGAVPSETAKGPQVEQIASTLSASYDSQLSASLGALATEDHLDLHLLDAYALINAGIANPSAYGFTNVTDPVWSGNFTNPASGTLAATGSAQNSYLFFDGKHPTAAAHALLADAAYASLTPTA